MSIFKLLYKVSSQILCAMIKWSWAYRRMMLSPIYYIKDLGLVNEQIGMYCILSHKITFTTPRGKKIMGNLEEYKNSCLFLTLIYNLTFKLYMLT